MVSKSTYVAVFVAVMMATVTASAVVVSTHEYGIVLDYKGSEPAPDWNEAVEKLNALCEQYLTFEVKWSARSNGLLCVCPDELTLGFLFEAVAIGVKKMPLPDGMTLDDLEGKNKEPANNYRHWNMYDLP